MAWESSGSPRRSITGRLARAARAGSERVRGPRQQHRAQHERGVGRGHLARRRQRVARPPVEPGAADDDEAGARGREVVAGAVRDEGVEAVRAQPLLQPAGGRAVVGVVHEHDVPARARRRPARARRPTRSGPRDAAPSRGRRPPRGPRAGPPGRVSPPRRSRPAGPRRRLPGQRVEEHAAERVHVGPRADRPSGELLGRQVSRCASRRAAAARLLDGHRQAEVAEVDLLLVAARVGHEDVPRLDVAVDETVAVGGVERVGHAADDPDGHAEREAPAAIDEILEAAVLDEPHRDVEPARLLAAAVHRAARSGARAPRPAATPPRRAAGSGRPTTAPGP